MRFINLQEENNEPLYANYVFYSEVLLYILREDS